MFCEADRGRGSLIQRTSHNCNLIVLGVIAQKGVRLKSNMKSKLSAHFYASALGVPQSNLEVQVESDFAICWEIGHALREGAWALRSSTQI